MRLSERSRAYRFEPNKVLQKCSFERKIKEPLCVLTGFRAAKADERARARARATATATATAQCYRPEANPFRNAFCTREILISNTRTRSSRSISFAHVRVALSNDHSGTIPDRL
ncbi:hypothetical protein HZH66_011596 [Vespula vulgaris]|uniref:Uncharacterized protein n=1 Tax=Vespula vulgaris TaxID=7454 RepID=A0A834JET8_VESVU|nr:hypothetical protein HZH66_011596 [Vespula vulgaris]